VDQLRIALLNEMEANSPMTVDQFNEVLDKEFSVFKGGKKYDFVSDLRDAYAPGLEKSANEKILETIPDYVFWDIKTPAT
jgi:predicted metalloprotease with PDZ domain